MGAYILNETSIVRFTACLGFIWETVNEVPGVLTTRISMNINVYISEQYISTTLSCFSDGEANWDGELKNPP
jgi:hypothetical protein